MTIVCLDLEGVLIPEIWINFSEFTKIPELRRTTRDEPDYDKLMNFRIDLLTRRGYTLSDIEQVIGMMDPLPGAVEFLEQLKEKYEVIILSDTFVQFAAPLLKKIGRPTIFCNSLVVNGGGMITGYTLRQKDGKRKAVEALKSIGYRVIAAGDSYNDLTMIQAADGGVLFRPPEHIITEYPDLPVTVTYGELYRAIVQQG